jgi:Leucine-rich repeat (LRR) protein
VDEWFGVSVENGRGVELDLPNNNMDDDIADEFTNLNALTYLDLSNNNIELPIYMSNMIGLEYLNVSDNGLYSIPDDLSQCTNLEVIICENNSMNYIPQNIGNLNNLVELDISGSDIGYIAPTLANLSSIEIIDFSNNGIYTLPENFDNLTTLTHLNLSDYHISEYNYSNIDNLTYLNLNNNDLTSLPEFIGDISTLEELRIGVNDLQEIPFGFENLTNLVAFEAHETGISELPESLFNIASLEELNLGTNNIQNLPETIASTDLQVLKLNNNQLDMIPEDYFDFELTDLWLNNNSLEFGSLEPFANQVSNEFTYDNQAILMEDTIVDVQIGENFSFTVEVSGDYNTYQWYKGPVLLQDQTTNTLMLDDISDDDIANYRLKVNNTVITDLELSTAYIELNLVTAINEIDQNDISIYPNPSVDFIQIESPEEISEIKVFNNSGQLILMRANLQNSTLHLSTKDLSNGVYTIEILSKDQTLRKRFIKK